MKMIDDTFDECAQYYNDRVHKTLCDFLRTAKGSEQQLQTAIEYTCLNGGKRIRALLVYATGEVYQATPYQLDFAAAAVELIHSYSLIHDDLPAMDNADLRRGKPACHRAFDEATAILAGDAQQALAFHLLARQSFLSTQQTLQMIQALSDAALKMVNGQALDITAELTNTNLIGLQQIHLGKTAALIKASILLGAIAGNAKQTALEELAHYGDHIGLAYQIHDDILDVESSAGTLGKPAQADVENNKVTYPAVCGLAAAKKAVQQHYTLALTHLEKIHLPCPFLKTLSARMIDRVY